MVFSSAIFLLLFLPVVFILNLLGSLAKKELSNIILLIASLIFYAWGEPYLVLLMMISIVINWLVGKLVDRSSKIKKKLLLAAGIVVDLGILGYYKYAGFLVSIINTIAGKDIIPVPQIALPIGISFFTFQAISYIIDVYRGETEGSAKLVNTALYISFFPQLIAGPIVKYKDINKQIEQRSITWEGVASGFKRFVYGLGKKVMLANVLGLCADTVFSYDLNALDWKSAWIGAIAYTFQIYFDFSGYSDMAIGLGKMFGFDIMENFNYPYISRSISEFWRRWHISLSAWFKEYVYIPLGGSRKGKFRTYLNIVIIFFLTGLWHGAAFSYIFWGLYNGFFTIIERLGFKKILDKSKILSTIYCTVVVITSMVIFRSNGVINGIKYISRMIAPWAHTDIQPIAMWNYLNVQTIVTMVFAFLAMGILKLVIPKKISEKWKDSIFEAIYIFILLILCLASIASDTYNPFIYFQF